MLLMRRPRLCFSLVLFLWGLASAPAQTPVAEATPSPQAVPPKVLFDFEGDAAGTSFKSMTKSVIGLRQAPGLAPGQANASSPPAGKALRIQAFAKSFVYAAAGQMPADLRPYSALRLWLHRSAEEAERHAATEVELQFVEEEGVRYWRKVVLDQVGWQAIELPLCWFSPAGGRLPRWDRVATFGIYFRSAGEVLVDGISLLPGPGPFVHPERDLRALAFETAEGVTLITKEHCWLLSNVVGRGQELQALADELAELQRRVLRDLALPDPLEPAGIIVFAEDAQYRRFAPRLAEQLGRKAGAPRGDGFTVLGIATTSADGELGLRRPVVVHEFVHSVLEKSACLAAVPDWFQEGVAAFYQQELRPQASLGEKLGGGYTDGGAGKLAAFCGPQAKWKGEYVLALTVVATLLSEPYRAKLPALIAAFQRAKSTDLGAQLGPILATDWDGFAAQWTKTCQQLGRR